jgi:hypothetical protein
LSHTAVRYQACQITAEFLPGDNKHQPDKMIKVKNDARTQTHLRFLPDLVIAVF